MKDPLLSKTPPHDLDAEQAVLSALFINNAGFDDIDSLQPADFYKTAHGKIFQAMQDLRRRQHEVDLVTVANVLDRSGQLDGIGGAVYLAQISDAAPMATNVGNYARIIKDMSAVRAVIRAAANVLEKGFTAGDAEEYISMAQAEMLKIQTTSSLDRFFDMPNLMSSALDRIEKAQTVDQELGFKLGFPTLDRIQIIFGSKLILLAGRPGMGKTALMLSIAKFLAETGVKVGILSIEMDKEALADRLLGVESNINSRRFYTKGELKSKEFDLLNWSADQLSGLPIYIDDSECTIQDVRRKCRKFNRMGCQVIFIDQLSKIRGKAGASKYDTYTDNCSEVALIKKELRMPIFLLCQINREVEQRSDKRPTLSDLKQTGALEEDADMIYFVFRPGYYDDSVNPSKAEIILAKHRHGSPGVEHLVPFNPQRSMFMLQR